MPIVEQPARARCYLEEPYYLAAVARGRCVSGVRLHGASERSCYKERAGHEAMSNCSYALRHTYTCAPAARALEAAAVVVAMPLSAGAPCLTKHLSKGVALLVLAAALLGVRVVHVLTRVISPPRVLIACSAECIKYTRGQWYKVFAC